MFSQQRAIAENAQGNIARFFYLGGLLIVCVCDIETGVKNSAL